ncbi:uncharacterized protein LOC111023669 [Momordica charantia]|uniref:Uncharacterized protein LOC111023669 n=1 Tax=Momordica charantia TaxID=3673 RepID=A0A6J1DRG1_MOMCH|nr:uncharacterized protein LOC111023669 [Momordica charantia]
MKYFPPRKNAKYRSEIKNFQQIVRESVNESWERFKQLLQKCPHHGIPRCIQIEKYYKGLDDATRLVIDASTNGALLVKPYAEAFNILERISSNNHSWSDPRAIQGRGGKGLNESESYYALNSKVENLTNLVMRSMTQQNTVGASDGKANVSHIQGISCSFCEGEHHYNNYPDNPESVYYLGNAQNNGKNSYSNTYNPGWRNHPNFSWSGNQGGNNAGTSNAPAYQQKESYPPDFSNQGQVTVQMVSEGSFASLENLMKKNMEKNDITVQSQAASLRNLEMQVGQWQQI